MILQLKLFLWILAVFHIHCKLFYSVLILIHIGFNNIMVIYSQFSGIMLLSYFPGPALLPAKYNQNLKKKKFFNIRRKTFEVISFGSFMFIAIL